MRQHAITRRAAWIGAPLLALCLIGAPSQARGQVMIGGGWGGGWGLGGMGWGGLGWGGGWGMGGLGWGGGFSPWGFGVAPGWGMGGLGWGGWGGGWGMGGLGYGNFWPAAYPYFGGYGNPYLDGGWTLASGISPLAVESAVIQRGLSGVVPLAGQKIPPGRYKITITIEPADDVPSESPPKDAALKEGAPLAEQK